MKILRASQGPLSSRFTFAAFTLMELLVIIALLAILHTLLLPYLISTQINPKDMGSGYNHQAHERAELNARPQPTQGHH